MTITYYSSGSYQSLILMFFSSALFLYLPQVSGIIAATLNHDPLCLLCCTVFSACSERLRSQASYLWCQGASAEGEDTVHLGFEVQPTEEENIILLGFHCILQPFQVQKYSSYELFF